MKIVRIIGGLGNQMFQYALALALKYRFPEDSVKIDIFAFNGYPLHNGFEISKVFPSKIEYANLSDILRISWPLAHYRLWQIGKRILPMRKTMCCEKDDYTLELNRCQDKSPTYFDGYWQSELYFREFRELILKDFTFPPFIDKKNSELASVLKNKTSVSIHIRRGDYVGHPMFRNICTMEYYRNAINYILKEAKVEIFCIFSNDKDWVKENFADQLGGIDTIFVDWNFGTESFRDMQLMSMCSHNIIANSSFSWWGAWLNQNTDAIIIAPDKWMNRDLKSNPICDNWIKIQH